MKILERGKFIDLPDRGIDEDEGDGWVYLHDWLIQKNSTKRCIAVFPYRFLWPTQKRINKIMAEIFDCNIIDFPSKRDTLVFWPAEIRKFSFGRKDDIILGVEGAISTTVSFLVEIKEYLFRLYPDFDYYIILVGTDIHIPRIISHFKKIFPSNISTRVMIDTGIVKLYFPLFSCLWFLKQIFRLREISILIFSTFFWGWYYKKALAKGRKK